MIEPTSHCVGRIVTVHSFAKACAGHVGTIVGFNQDHMFVRVQGDQRKPSEPPARAFRREELDWVKKAVAS